VLAAVDRHPGDLLLRGSLTEGFVLVDMGTGEPLSAHGLSLMDALSLAKTFANAALWQQITDERGRPLGEPFRAVVSL
jgi:hypothetical protein